MGVALEGRGAAGGDPEVAQLDVAGAVAGPDQRVALGARGVRRGAPRRPSSSRRRAASRAPCNARYRPRGGPAGPPPRAMLRRARGPALADGERSSVGRAPGCGPGGRGFESHRSPLTAAVRAGVAELAYALGLGPSGATLGGSSPLTRTDMALTTEVTPSRRTASGWTSRSPGTRSSRAWSGPSGSWAARSASPGSGPARRRPRSSSSASAARPSSRRCSRARWASGTRRRVARPASMPIDDPELDLEDVPEAGDLTFKATVQVRPEGDPRRVHGASRSARPSPRCPRARSTQQLDAPARARRAARAGRAARRDGRLPDHRLRRLGRRQAAAQRDRPRLPGGARRRAAWWPSSTQRLAGAERPARRSTFPVTYGDDGPARRAARAHRRLHGHRQAGAGEGAAGAGRRPGHRRQRVRHASTSCAPTSQRRLDEAAAVRRSTSSSGAWSSTPPSPTATVDVPAGDGQPPRRHDPPADRLPAARGRLVRAVPGRRPAARSSRSSRSCARTPRWPCAASWWSRPSPTPRASRSPTRRSRSRCGPTPRPPAAAPERLLHDLQHHGGWETLRQDLRLQKAVEELVDSATADPDGSRPRPARSCGPPSRRARRPRRAGRDGREARPAGKLWTPGDPR